MRLWAEIRERLRALLFRSREEHDMSEEIRFHIEMETERLIADGFRPEEARRRAHVAFGGEERFKEEIREARGISPLENTMRDVRHAARRLVREPGFSIPAVATVALGVGVSVSVFALVNAVVLEPLPFPEPERLVTLSHSAHGAEFPVDGLSMGTFLHYRRHNRVFEDIGVYAERNRSVTDAEGTPEQVRVADVSPGLLGILRARPHLGRLLVEEDATPGTASGVIISHSLWVRRYGADPDIVGRVIEVERVGREVMGVMEADFTFPHAATDIWYTSWRPDSASTLGTFYMQGVARLHPDIAVADAEADLQQLVRTLPDALASLSREGLDELGLQAEIQPLKDGLLGDELRTALRLLFGMGAFLLLITWANVLNLSLARAERQRKELMMTRMLGARSVDLARRFFVEAFAIATLGGAAGLALTYATIQARFGLDPDAVPRLRNVAMDGQILGLGLILVLLTAALLTVASSQSGRSGPTTIRGMLALNRSTAGRRQHSIRRVLVAAQLALTLALLTGSALMAQSLWRLQQVRLGSVAEDRIVFHLPTPPNSYESTNHYHAQVRLHSGLLENLRTIPGVDAVEAATASGFPLTPVPSYYRSPIARSDTPVSERAWPHALRGFATPGYFDAMGMPLVQGRTFGIEDTGEVGHGVVLSESLARSLFGDSNAVGQSVRWGVPSEDADYEDPDYTVVGVVGDVPSEAIEDGPSPVIYFPNLHPPRADTITGVVHIYVPSNETYVVRTRRSVASMFPSIRAAIREEDPKLVMTRFGTLDGLVEDSTARTRVTMLILVTGTVTSLVLALIGIYGLLSYTVGQRTSELGVRMALGADPARVVRMVVRQGAVLAVYGVAIGLSLALALTQFLDVLLFEVSPVEPTALLGAAALLMFAALAASWIPARRAAATDPTEALRAA